MDESEWVGAEPSYPPIPNYTANVCPGFVRRQKFVDEAQAAVRALRMGELLTYFPFGENTVLQSAMDLDAAYSQYESEQLKKPS